MSTWSPPRRADHAKKGKPKGEAWASTLTITALGLVLCISTGATHSVQAGHHSRGHAATHHAEAYRGRKVICFVTRNRATHTARKVCRPVGGYSRLTARRVLWGPAGIQRQKTSDRTLTFRRTLSIADLPRLPIRAGNQVGGLLGIAKPSATRKPAAPCPLFQAEPISLTSQRRFGEASPGDTDRLPCFSSHFGPGPRM